MQSRERCQAAEGAGEGASEVFDSPEERSWFARVPYSRRAGPPEPLPAGLVDLLVSRALREDVGTGDVTSEATVPAGARARARLVSKASGRIAGLAVFRRAFELCDPSCRFEALVTDGNSIEPGDEVARVEGGAYALLTAERTALNFVQRMSGIATLTRLFVDAVEREAGAHGNDGGRDALAGPVRILDTRKTNPGLRPFDKFAVRCGGGENHRYGLFDEAMVKNNHVDLAGRPLEDVVRDLRLRCGDRFVITSEARDEAEAEAGVRGGADVVLLDNMSPERMSALVPKLRGLAAGRGRSLELEASGGVDLATISRIARTGVDRISIGALTHSAPALDLSLRLESL